MSYELYLDIYFLVNLVMNYTVLRMTGILGKEHSRKRRCFFAAAGGSVAMCIGMILGVYKIKWITAMFCMMVEVLMTTASFSWRGPERFMYRAVIFRLLSLLAEGSWQILRDYFRMPFPYSMAAGILLPFLILLTVKRREEKEKFLYPVTIRFHGKEQHLTALWDSGNTLTQPLTGKPVHIINMEVLTPLLDQAEQKELQDLSNLNAVENPSGLFSFVPYQSIGKKYGLLPVLKLDEILVEKEKEIVNTPEVLVAVSKDILSSCKAYQMILHQSLR